jgi:class 3 adenylate cyclase/tetratricopeptide (TPR) repeat protein
MGAMSGASSAESGPARLAKARRHVTVLFSDLVGFTGLAERLDEEETYELVRRLTDEQERIVGLHGGAIRDFAGDGIMALFGAPVASENAAEQACSAALAIHQRMRELAPEFAKKYGKELRLRIGVHTGPAVVGNVSDRQLSYSALGDSVNLAARLQSAAEPGTVAISAATHELVATFFDCEYVGEAELKGKAEPQSIYKCTARKPDAARFDAARLRGLSAFVGRGDEMDRLIAVWRTKGDTARFVSIEGEAGIGKSRLLHEFRQIITKEGAKIVQGDCMSGGNAIPYMPFVSIIRRSLRISDGEALNRDAVVRGLESLGVVDEDPPYLLNLLGLRHAGEQSDGLGPLSSAELVRKRTKRALLQMIAALAGNTPALLVIEDAHWIDNASEDVLAECLEEEALTNLMVICTMRPGYRPPWGHDNLVRLKPLDESGALAIVRERLRDRQTDFGSDFLKFAVEKADGNPLFVEEIANYWLAQPKAKDKTSHEENPSFRLPSSLENLLLARVDGLDDAPKGVLRTASVVGRHFSTTLVKEVGDTNKRFDDDLGTLERREFVYPDLHDRWSDYAFKHALIQDAVYNSIVISERRAIHARVAEVIEHHFGNQLGEVAEVLASHYRAAGEPAKAIRFLQMAGDKAFRLFSLNVADAYYREAVGLIEERNDPSDDKTLGELIANWGQIHCWRLNFAEMRQVTERYLARVERRGETRELSRLLQWMGEAYLSSARFDESEKALNRALEIASRNGDAESATFAKADLVYLALLSCDRFPADYIARNGRAILRQAERNSDHYHRWFTLLLLFNDQLQRGLINEAREIENSWSAFAEETGYPPAVTFAWLSKSFIALYDGVPDEARRCIDKALALANGETERETVEMGRAIVLTLTGRAGEALETLGKISRIARSTENDFMLAWSETYYGMALATTGDLGAAVDVLTKAAAMYAAWGNTPKLAEAYFMLGQVFLEMATSKERPTVVFLRRNWRFLARHMLSARKEAKQHFEKSIDLAATSGCPGWGAYSLLCLGKLALASRDPNSARSHLTAAEELSRDLGWKELDREIEQARRTAG